VPDPAQLTLADGKNAPVPAVLQKYSAVSSGAGVIPILVTNVLVGCTDDSYKKGTLHTMMPSVIVSRTSRVFTMETPIYTAVVRVFFFSEPSQRWISEERICATAM
jgi:hypothetical protein